MSELKMKNAGHANAFAKRVYEILQTLLRGYWRITRGRKERVFGDDFLFDPSTHFPSFRRLKLPRNEIFSTIVRYGDYVQTHSAYRIVHDVKHEPVVVDVGAHHGIYAVLLGKAAQRKKGTVLAIEPNPSAFKILQENVKLNALEDTIRCENIGIMDREGSLSVLGDDEQSRILESETKEGFQVKVQPLSKLLKKYALASIDLLIIDVEGAELKVLRSIDWKKTEVKNIFCELHPYNWKTFGHSGKDLSLFLERHEFRCFDMYLREHRVFEENAYIGPTFFIRENIR